MKKLLVSRCLLGESCRYDGKSKPCRAVLDLKERFILIPVCPECDGGLPTPRVPSERVGDRVLNREGKDVTCEYMAGARHALAVCIAEGIDTAVLKARSPSCGKGKIYDGSFTRTLVEGDGVTVEYLKAHGIKIYTEDELDALEKGGREE